MERMRRKELKPKSFLHEGFAVVAILLASAALAQQPAVALVERGHPKGTVFSADSALLLSGADGYYQLWNWREEKFVGPRMLIDRQFGKGRSGAVLAADSLIRFSRDGRFMAACRDRMDTDSGRGEAMLAQVWDLHSGETVVNLPSQTPMERCGALDFSPDGKVLAVASSTVRGNAAVIQFDTAQWRELRRIDLGREVKLHRRLKYSPNGGQIVVWVTDYAPVPGVSIRETSEAFRRIGTNFMDHRIAAVVLDAGDGRLLARKVLHWFPNQAAITGYGDGFDASGERIISSSYAGGVFEGHAEKAFLNCPNYVPPSVPEGFAATDICRRHKEVQIWNWRSGNAETLFETPTYVRSRHAVESPEQRTWTYVSDTQFTADGRYLVLLREVVDKADFSPALDHFTPHAQTLEIRDGRSYELLLTKAFAPKKDEVTGPIQLSPDGRYLTFVVTEQHRGPRPHTKYLYEIVTSNLPAKD